MLTRLDPIDIAAGDLEPRASHLETIAFAVIRRTSRGGGSVELSIPSAEEPFFELTSTRRPDGGMTMRGGRL